MGQQVNVANKLEWQNSSVAPIIKRGRRIVLGRDPDGSFINKKDEWFHIWCDPQHANIFWYTTEAIVEGLFLGPSCCAILKEDMKFKHFRIEDDGKPCYEWTSFAHSLSDEEVEFERNKFLEVRTSYETELALLKDICEV